MLEMHDSRCGFLRPISKRIVESNPSINKYVTPPFIIIFL